MSSPISAGSRPKWLIPVGIVVAVVVVLGLIFAGSYNGMVDREEAVEQSFADLDAVLQRRADLIPGLANAVKAALRQEQEIFDEITDARAAYAGAPQGSDERVEAGAQLESVLGRLLVIVEDNPELKSNETIQDFMTQFEGTENRVAQARRDYNDTTTEFNRTIRRFPRSIFAGIFGFERRPLFEAEEGDREAPEVDLEVNLDDEE